MKGYTVARQRIMLDTVEVAFSKEWEDFVFMVNGEIVSRGSEHEMIEDAKRHIRDTKNWYGIV